MVPHIMSLEDAENVVHWTRFHPIGLRPVDGGNADGSFCLVDFNDYIEQANERRFVAIQIEDPEPLEELDAICALPGIDMIFFGPGDFSQSSGAPGVFDHPKLLEAKRLVAETAVKHGKFAGTPGSIGNMKELYDMGYRFVNLGADVVALSGYFQNITDEFQKVFGQEDAGGPAAESTGIYK
jgi:4-hydroxy-2-oxoheptanedioate aldolase